MPLDALITVGLLAKQKSLPPVLFYDEAGSDLFDEITRTPEYYLTRAERSILDARGPEILRRANGHGPLSLVELGAGSADKTRLLLRPLLAHQGEASYVPIDVSPTAVLRAADALARDLPGLRVRPIVDDNEAALARLPTGGPAKLFLFLGSSVGNLEPDETHTFLRGMARRMRREDRLLLSTDLVKDARMIEAAYNDAAGVTARFNLNALERLNREHGADFDLDAFVHRAFYNERRRRIEMHLVSDREQRVTVPKLGITLNIGPGETIHTENSYKYTQADVNTLASSGGLALDRSWTDDEGLLAIHLFQAVAP